MKLALTVLCLITPILLHANRFYVDELASPGGDGSSWDSAFNYLQDALDQTVAGRGDEVWIAAGTYYPDEGVSVTSGDRYASFILRNGVTLAGGFTGAETSLEERDVASNETILSGAIGADPADYSLHVLRAEGDATLDGLTVSDGNANLDHEVHGKGGGIYAQFLTVKLTSCTLRNNFAHLEGGGVCGDISAEDCSFLYNSTGNSGNSTGGAVSGSIQADWCIFDSNSSELGGAVSNLEGGIAKLDDCLFSNNTATQTGGGILAGTIDAVQCDFTGNESDYGGAASAGGTMTACSFSNNYADTAGGAIDSLGIKLIDSIVMDNGSDFEGGAIYGDIVLDGCEISGNSSPYFGGAVSGNVEATDSTFIGNRSEVGGGIAGNASLQACIFNGNSATLGAGAIEGSVNAIHSSFGANSAHSAGAIDGDGTFLGCDFSGNEAWASGPERYGSSGAVAVSGSIFIDTYFSGNHAQGAGGAIGAGGSVAINCNFSGNSAYLGGAIAGEMLIVNCKFSGNSAEMSDYYYEGMIVPVGRGSAISGNPTIINSTFEDNTAWFGGTILARRDTRILNSIISDPDGISVYAERSTILISNRLDSAPESPRAPNLIEGGLDSIMGTTNIDFGDATTYLVNDPVDTGNNEILPADTYDLDQDGDTTESLPMDHFHKRRIQNGTVDLGAMESGDESPRIPIEVAISAEPDGAGMVSPENGAYQSGDAIELTAIPTAGYLFSGWGGDVSGDDNPATFISDSDVSITAIFTPDNADNDFDGLSNYEEAILYGSNPGESDTSGDWIMDGEAVAAGLDPTGDYSSAINVIVTDPIRFGVDSAPFLPEAVATILADPDTYKLYSEMDIMYMNVGGLTLKWEDGPLLLNFAIEVSDDLNYWEVAELIEREVDPGPDNLFVRLNIGPPKVANPGFVPVPAGSFLMGLPEGEPGSYAGDTQHLVTLNRPFYIKQTEVTYAEWQEVRDWTLLPENSGLGYALPTGVMGANIAASTPQHPVTHVSWYAALAWCNARSEMEGRQPAYYIDAAHSAVYRDGTADFQNAWVDWEADGYRLPTEAEWEYACRAGTTTSFYTGPITATQFRFCENLDAAGWYGGNSGNNTHPVGEKVPNLIGLSDTHGNVWEWVWDRHEDFTPSPTIDPLGPDTGTDRLMRGGSYNNNAENCQSSSRFPNPPANSGSYGGFRAAISR